MHPPEMQTTTELQSQPREFGFSISEGADWSEYLAFRPLYPKSFFDHIYNYHFRKPQAQHFTAHDVGAGCGIVSSALAARFRDIIVSDPNDGYTTLARKLLVQDSGIPASKFTFLQEGAEKSSIPVGTVDLITACEMMHWTDPVVAVKEFSRELKVGGTLALTYYTRPRIVGNDAAQKVWKAIFNEYSKRAQGELYDHALEIVNSGLQCVGFPADEWGDVKRVYINSGGSVDPFKIDDRLGESRVAEGEETVWLEGDEGWCNVQGIDWLKGYFATWVPKIPEIEIQDAWNAMDSVLAGATVEIETPIVIVLATKKA